MSNIKIYYLNHWDLNPVTADSQEDNFPGTNTRHRWKTYPWIAPLAPSNWIKINGTAIPMTGIFVYCHNLTPSATAQIQGSNDDFATPPAYQADLVKGDNLLAHLPMEPQTHNAWRIRIEDPANTNGTIQLGRVWLGESWEPAHGYNSKSKWQPVSPSISNSSDGGQETTIIKTPYMSGTLQFDCISHDEFLSFYQTVYYHKPFVILKKPPAYKGIDYPGPGKNAYYVKMEKHTHTPTAGDKIKLKMTLKEER